MASALEELYIAGPPNNGAGVNVVALDYGDRLFSGILTFADSVEDPGELADGLERAFRELKQATEARCR